VKNMAKKILEIDEETSEILQELAKKEGVTPSEILKHYLKDYLKQEGIIDKELENLMKLAVSEKETTDKIKDVSSKAWDMVMMKFLKSAMKDDSTDMIKVMQTAVLMNYLNSMQQQKKSMLGDILEPLIAMRLVDNLSNQAQQQGDNNMIQLLNQVKSDLQNQIAQLVAEKKTREAVEEAMQYAEERANATEEAVKKFLEEKLGKVVEDIAELKGKLSTGQYKKSELEELVDKIESVKKVVDALGFAEKKITTPEGKIDWGAVINEGLKTVRSAIEARAKAYQPPPYQPPQYPS